MEIMSYKESVKNINSIRSHDEMMFRMAISHLMDVGIRHLNDEIVKATCDSIMQEDDSKQFMTNEFKCQLIKTAAELAKIDHIHLLVYISKYVKYDVR